MKMQTKWAKSFLNLIEMHISTVAGSSMDWLICINYSMIWHTTVIKSSIFSSNQITEKMEEN